MNYALSTPNLLHFLAELVVIWLVGIAISSLINLLHAN